MDTEINDLLDEHEIVTFTDIANQLQVHVNKGNFVNLLTSDKRSFGMLIFLFEPILQKMLL